MTRTMSTFCRICEPNCPLIAELDDRGDVVGLAPVVDHPSGSTACHKGLSFIDVHDDPDRIGWPQRRTTARTDEGAFARDDWSSALRDIGTRLRKILDEHGPNSIALFQGNPTAFDSATLLTIGPFLSAIGTSMKFGSATQDMSNKTTGAGHIYGSTAAFYVPDLEHTDYLLCLGANPRVSRWTVMSAPQDNLDVLRDIVDRGGKVRFVNPRQIESSTAETGPTLLIKPGTDVYFLAAVLHEIHGLRGFDETMIRERGKHFDELMDFVAHYPAEAIEAVTGIEASDTRQIAAELAAAPTSIVYVSTGVNQSRQGLLAFWLAEMINFATGNLGRTGGMFKPTGLNDTCAPIVGTKVIETSIGGLTLPDPPGYSKLPAVLIPDLIESGDIRALVSLHGNPLLTVGGEERMRAAFDKLDLMVSIDIYRNATGELADYILPGTDLLERPDITLTPSSSMQLRPHVMYTDAVVQPMYERRDAWWILSSIAHEMGLESPLDAVLDDGHPTVLFDAALAGRGLSVDQLKVAPSNTVLLAENPKDYLFEQCLVHPDHLVDCFPPAFAAEGLIERCAQIYDELAAEEPGGLKLISLRTKYMQNSAMVNVSRFRRGRNHENPLHMCEQDAASRGLFDGDLVRVWNEWGELEVRVYIDDDLRPGVVAMSHGYGGRGATSMRTSARKPGVNCNVLMPSGTGSYEELSFMSWLSGVPVEVAAASPPLR